MCKTIKSTHVWNIVHKPLKSVWDCICWVKRTRIHTAFLNTRLLEPLIDGVLPKAGSQCAPLYANYVSETRRADTVFQSANHKTNLRKEYNTNKYLDIYRPSHLLALVCMFMSASHIYLILVVWMAWTKDRLNFHH